MLQHREDPLSGALYILITLTILCGVYPYESFINWKSISSNLTNYIV
jgi:hypothetical protein